MNSASNIYRQSREIYNERMNNPTTTTKHSASNLSNDRNERINNSFQNILSNGSSGNNNGFDHDDDKFTISSDAHSLPIVAPAEPKSKSKFSFDFVSHSTLLHFPFVIHKQMCDFMQCFPHCS